MSIQLGCTGKSASALGPRGFRRAFLCLGALCAALCLAAGQVWAQANSDAVVSLLKTLRAVNATEAPRLFQDDDGFVRFVGAPPRGFFESQATRTKLLSDPSGAALDFVDTHKAAFGAASERTDFDAGRVRRSGDRTYVLLEQRYGELEVMGGSINVQFDGAGGVESVLSRIMTNTSVFESSPGLLTPVISPDGARSIAIEATASSTVNVGTADLESSEPELRIFDPSLFGRTGSPRVIWYTEVSRVDGLPLRDATLVDARTGVVVRQFSLLHTVKFRQVHDAQNEFVLPGPIARVEGQPPTGISDVDDAFTFLGDTYDFFFDEHGRDGIDGFGGPIIATVRFGTIFNAFWDGFQTAFGEGFETDDVVAHEYTHGVTQFTSGLIFMDDSGAINESFSDIWGEYVDLTNTGGDDSPGARWLLGEDLPDEFLVTVPTQNPPARAIRSMANPPEFVWFPFDRDRRFVTPDRLNHPDFYRGVDDNGGVHFNSGVGNKLAFLLTDGGNFNNREVFGLGISKVADLLFEVQTNFLGPSADYFDLFFALGQAAVNLGLPELERRNIKAAAEAVEIVPLSFGEAVDNLRAVSSDGVDVVELTYDLDATPSQTFRITRRQNVFPVSPFDGEFVGFATGDNFIDDDPLPLGEELFYGIFADDLSTGFPAEAFARVTVGDPIPNFLTESFTNGTDLSFTQILFSPTVDVGEAADSGRPESFVDYSHYTATVIRDPAVVSRLPVARDDEETGGSFNVIITEDTPNAAGAPVDGIVVLPLNVPFPYFGREFNTLFIGANGYVALDSVSTASFANFPSMASHFTIPRISALLADLELDVAGSVWVKGLADRAVITWENVTEATFTPGNFPATTSFQLELFYSGHIRMTYLDVNVENAIIGISDGRGVPRDPESFFLDPLPVTDFTADFDASLPDAPTFFPPVPNQTVDEGDFVEFTAQAVSGEGGPPRLEAEWDRTEPIDFQALPGTGTGVFRWQTGPDSEGRTTVTLRATVGDRSVTQNVTIFVSNVIQLPEARNRLLRTNEPGETDAEAAQSRNVDDEVRLFADFEYFHPRADTQSGIFGEGDNVVSWFRNNVLVTALQNRLEVPANATQPGDRWFYRVIPVAQNFLAGTEVQSPTVTIVANPEVTSITPNMGRPRGGELVTIRGIRLNAPTSVRFGGVPSPNVGAISSTEIQAETPPNFEGTVDVRVETQTGSTTVPDGFTYGPEQVNMKADVDGNGDINATDLQIVLVAMMEGALTKTQRNADVSGDGSVNSVDVQVVVNEILRR